MLLALLPATAFARDDLAGRPERADRPTVEDPLVPEETTRPPTDEERALKDEYQYVYVDKPGLGGPIAITLSGLAAAGLGGAGIYLFQQNEQAVGLPVALTIGGAVMAVAGIAWWAVRAGQRAESDRKLLAIKQKLASHGFRLAKRDEDPPAPATSFSPGFPTGFSWDDARFWLGTVALVALAGVGIAALIHH